MLIWDFETPTRAFKLHHLTVLCYHLQHPSLYSPEALESAKKFLRSIIEKDVFAQKLLGINRQTLTSNGRTWKIKGTLESHGSYQSEIKWSMTAFDIVTHGLSSYTEMVQKWAESIYEDLKISGNLI
jgi:hypothetical protein